jgi:NADH:ubiquinone oxidoreductase subunit E
MTETLQLIKNLADQYGRQRDALMPILQGLVEAENYISDIAMTEIAKELDIATAEVYGTATFYSFLDTVPRGKFVIRVCKTITCDMHGKKRIVETIENLLKIKLGETTQDKKFSLLHTNCIGWCHQGPAMLINSTPYGDLNEEKVTEILMEYMRK